MDYSDFKTKLITKIKTLDEAIDILYDLQEHVNNYKRSHSEGENTMMSVYNLNNDARYILNDVKTKVNNLYNILENQEMFNSIEHEIFGTHHNNLRIKVNNISTTLNTDHSIKYHDFFNDKSTEGAIIGIIDNIKKYLVKKNFLKDPKEETPNDINIGRLITRLERLNSDI